jgi:hypothetical protein
MTQQQSLWTYENKAVKHVDGQRVSSKTLQTLQTNNEAPTISLHLGINYRSNEGQDAQNACDNYKCVHYVPKSYREKLPTWDTSHSYTVRKHVAVARCVTVATGRFVWKTNESKIPQMQGMSWRAMYQLLSRRLNSHNDCALAVLRITTGALHMRTTGCRQNTYPIPSTCTNYRQLISLLLGTNSKLYDAGPVWGRSATQLPGAPTSKRHQDVTEVIGNMVPVNSGYTRNNFPENYP